MEQRQEEDEHPAKKVKIEKVYSTYLNSFFPPPHASKASFPEEIVLSYVTPWKMAEKVTKWILDQHYNIHKRELDGMVDGTANIGGNTLNFCLNKTLRFVVGVELNKDRYEDLKKNMDLYRRERYSSPELVCGNFVDWWRSTDRKRFKNAGVFLDPPWGGSDYHLTDKIDDLTLTGDDGVENGMVKLTREILADASCVVLKLPYNYNMRTLTVHFECFAFYSKKCLFVFIDHTTL